MLRWARDVISGIVVLIVAIGGFVYSFDIEEGAVANPLAGAGAYIRLWMVILALLAVILIVKSIWKRTSEHAPALMYPLIYITLAAIILYVGLMSFVGYTPFHGSLSHHPDGDLRFLSPKRKFYKKGFIEGKRQVPGDIGGDDRIGRPDFFQVAFRDSAFRFAV